MSETDMREGYRKFILKKLLFVSFFTAVTFVALGVSITIGGRDIHFSDVYRLLFDHMMGVKYTMGTSVWMDDYIVWNTRLPRALFAIIAGAGLAIGGAAMQSVMNNPLADPYTTGISSGAYFGVAVAVVLGFSAMGTGGQFGLVGNALIFALIPMVLILALSPADSGGRRASPVTLILAGVAISYMFNAMSTLLLVMTDAEKLSAVYQWQIGSLWRITWDSIPIVFSVTVVGVVLLMYLSKKLNILTLGSDSASSLGINVKRLRLACLVIMSLIVAAVISFAGIIGFVGLISPHIVRMFIDADNRFVIPASAAFGASFLLVCDILARVISNIGAMPVGVVMSFIGAPIFLILIIRQRRGLW